ncbi:hypothetical protein [Nodosilinea sp. E11]|uniref:hypothetical protein n=1 Tax=Nodosilinea sp. E11 TaxID=3037479 RepID=UPI0029344D6E|nr:hypothetical protein [Nodosilinea sp. E11]WOD40831.1 hypothetical protein RRF56_08490 [Nodosilinea sp. E11]
MAAIAAFQGEWPVQKHTLYLLDGLAHAGYDVDFFCLESFFTDDPKDFCGSGVHIHRFSYSEAKPGDLNGLQHQAAWFADKTRSLHRKYLNLTQNTRSFIPAAINRRVQTVATAKQYLCLIGIEKLGLVWAAQWAEQWHIPYLYYSLELYTRDHFFITSRRYWRRLKKAEQFYCQNLAALIIQDQARAEVLLKDNELGDRPVIPLPISLPGSPYSKSSTYLRDKFQLPADSVLILQFGQIQRYGKALVQLAQQFPEKYRLVLHDGLTQDLWQCEAFVEELKQLDRKNRVVFSLENLPFDQIQALSASADVGLVFYSNTPINDQLTGRSSEKLALYLQCGLPVIGFRYPGYEPIETAQAGVLITDLEEIGSAVQTILNAHPTYRHRAQQLFLAEYQFEKNVQPLVQYLASLATP